MLFESIRINKDDIKVGNSKFVKEFVDDIIDIGLEGAGGVA